MTISAGIYVKRSDAVLSARIGQDLVLMNPASGAYCGLDTIGAEIWERLAEPILVRTLCESLLLDYEAETCTIERDVIALLNGMAEQRLVEESN
jgi:hypothetical protein